MSIHPADFLPAGALVSPAPTTHPARHFPVLFLSDLHLGSRACRDDLLLSFLQAHTADVIYLVGDIIDTWLPLGVHWTAAQQQVLAILFDRARQGARLVFTPGNHDAFFRRFIGQSMLGVEIHDRILHKAADASQTIVCAKNGKRANQACTYVPLSGVPVRDPHTGVDLREMLKQMGYGEDGCDSTSKVCLCKWGEAVTCSK